LDITVSFMNKIIQINSTSFALPPKGEVSSEVFVEMHITRRNNGGFPQSKKIKCNMQWSSTQACASMKSNFIKVSLNIFIPLNVIFDPNQSAIMLTSCASAVVIIRLLTRAE